MGDHERQIPMDGENLDCPCCGGEGHLSVYLDGEWVVCEDCSARARARDWNTRVASTGDAERLLLGILKAMRVTSEFPKRPNATSGPAHDLWIADLAVWRAAERIRAHLKGRQGDG